jgi:hypothetical protein
MDWRSIAALICVVTWFLLYDIKRTLGRIEKILKQKG